MGRLRETEQQLRKDAEKRLKEMKRKIENESLDEIEDAERRFMIEGEEKVEELETKLQKARDRLADLKGEPKETTNGKADAESRADGGSKGSYDYSDRSDSTEDW